MVVKEGYIPDRGDIAWIDFNPTRGHEQSGRRPALVVSPKSYNVKSGLALVCPVTSQEKEYPFEVVFKTRAVSGVVLADQVRSIDWRERRIEKAGAIPDTVLVEVQTCARKLISG